MAKMNTVDWIATVLVVIGGLNWGLVGLLNLDVVAYLGATVAKVVYVLVGLSALWMIYMLAKMK